MNSYNKNDLTQLTAQTHFFVIIWKKCCDCQMCYDL